jgi:hypothetical protein
LGAGYSVRSIPSVWVTSPKRGVPQARRSGGGSQARDEGTHNQRRCILPGNTYS